MTVVKFKYDTAIFKIHKSLCYLVIMYGWLVNVAQEINEWMIFPSRVLDI